MKKNVANFELLGRGALSLIFIWFGLLKIFGVSPANGLVSDLLKITLPFVKFEYFIVFLGFWEALIGFLFLFPRLTKLAFWLMLVQMLTTFGPLMFLPNATWQTFLLVPTLEGQYIIKNLALTALGYGVYEIAIAREKLKK